MHFNEESLNIIVNGLVNMDHPERMTIRCTECDTPLYTGPVLGLHVMISCSCGYVLDCVIGENN